MSGAQRLRLWAPAIAWMAGIFVLSSLQSIPSPPEGFTDKDGHALLYCVLAALMLRGLAGGAWRGVTWWRAGAAVCLAVLYGISDEYHQSFVPGRTADVADVVADATGAVLAAGGLWAWGIIRGLFRSSSKQP